MAEECLSLKIFKKRLAEEKASNSINQDTEVRIKMEQNLFEDELENFRTFWRTNEKFDSTLYFLALDGDEVAGVSLCYRLLMMIQTWVGLVAWVFGARGDEKG
jgi:hypothetical protein